MPDHPARFRTDFNLDAPDSLYPYKNAEKGIEFKIPYNEKWGNPDCKVNPYGEGDDEVVQFGKPYAGGEYRLEFLESRTAEEILRERAEISGGKGANIEKYFNLSLDNANSMGRKRIGKLDVVRINNFGMCETIDLIVIGKKFNYRFSTCSAAKTAKEIISDLESMIKTVNLY